MFENVTDMEMQVISANVFVRFESLDDTSEQGEVPPIQQISEANSHRLFAMIFDDTMRSAISNDGITNSLDGAPTLTRANLARAILAAAYKRRGDKLPIDRFTFPSGEDAPDDDSLSITHDEKFHSGLITYAISQEFNVDVNSVLGQPARPEQAIQAPAPVDAPVPAPAAAPMDGAALVNMMSAQMDRGEARTEAGMEKIAQQLMADPTKVDLMMANDAIVTALKTGAEALKTITGPEDTAAELLSQTQDIFRRDSTNDKALHALKTAVLLGKVIGSGDTYDHLRALHTSLKGRVHVLCAGGKLKPFQRDVHRLTSEAANKLMRHDASVFDANCFVTELCLGTASSKSTKAAEIKSKADLTAYTDCMLNIFEALGAEVNGGPGQDTRELIVARSEFLNESCGIDDYGLIVKNYIKPGFQMWSMLRGDTDTGWIAKGGQDYPVFSVFKHTRMEDVHADEVYTFSELEKNAAQFLIDKYNEATLLGMRNGHIDTVAINTKVDNISKALDNVKKEGGKRVTHDHGGPDPKRQSTDFNISVNSGFSSPASGSPFTPMNQFEPPISYMPADVKASYQPYSNGNYLSQAPQASQGPAAAAAPAPAPAAPLRVGGDYLSEDQLRMHTYDQMPSAAFGTPMQGPPHGPPPMTSYDDRRYPNDSSYLKEAGRASPHGPPVLPTSLKKKTNGEAVREWKKRFPTPKTKPAQCFWNAISSLQGFESYGKVCGRNCGYLHPGQKVTQQNGPMVIIPPLDRGKLQKFANDFKVPRDCDQVPT